LTVCPSYAFKRLAVENDPRAASQIAACDPHGGLSFMHLEMYAGSGRSWVERQKQSLFAWWVTNRVGVACQAEDRQAANHELSHLFKRPV